MIDYGRYAIPQWFFIENIFCTSRPFLLTCNRLTAVRHRQKTQTLPPAASSANGAADEAVMATQEGNPLPSCCVDITLHQPP